MSEYREHNESDKADIEDDMALVRTRTDHIIDDIVEMGAAFSEFKGELRRVNGGRSSLEQVVMLPDEIAHRADLTKNQLRAREIASDIKQLAKKAPAGQIVHSASIKDKLTDLYNKAHDTTVARVMDFIDDSLENSVKSYTEMAAGRSCWTTLSSINSIAPNSSRKARSMASSRTS